jgi:hypothetical protein
MIQASIPNHLRRSALAVGLCLLAFVFALEAKFAWYGPANGPLTTIQSAKALPTDLPELVSHGVSVHPDAPLQLALICLSALVTAVLVRAESFCRLDLASKRRSLSATSYFSPGLFFRPPPASRIL